MKKQEMIETIQQHAQENYDAYRLYRKAVDKGDDVEFHDKLMHERYRVYLEMLDLYEKFTGKQAKLNY